jgi:hypothetical protein
VPLSLRLTNARASVGLSNCSPAADSIGRCGRQFEGFPIRLPFFDPSSDEVATVATDLITRFGLRAHYEAAYLAELAVQMRSRRNKVLYELVTREIDVSFAEARRQLSLRQSIPSVSLAPDLPTTSLVAELNLIDINASPRRRFGSR